MRKKKLYLKDGLSGWKEDRTVGKLGSEIEYSAQGQSRRQVRRVWFINNLASDDESKGYGGVIGSEDTIEAKHFR